MKPTLSTPPSILPDAPGVAFGVCALAMVATGKPSCAFQMMICPSSEPDASTRPSLRQSRVVTESLCSARLTMMPPLDASQIDAAAAIGCGQARAVGAELHGRDPIGVFGNLVGQLAVRHRVHLGDLRRPAQYHQLAIGADVGRQHDIHSSPQHCAPLAGFHIVKHYLALTARRARRPPAAVSRRGSAQHIGNAFGQLPWTRPGEVI